MNILPPPWRQMFGAWRLGVPLWGFYRIHLMAVGIELGLFEALAPDGATLESLAAGRSLDRELLAAWLALAAKARLVRKRDDRYVLSRFAKTHLLPGSLHYLGDTVREAVSLQSPFLRKLPELIRTGQRVREEPGATVLGALGSIVLEPFAFRILDRLPVRQPNYRVLDVGCGHGDYLRHLARANPTLTGVGVEITEEGASIARRRVEADRLAGRIQIVQADARDLLVGTPFHLCLLNNNIYYFHPKEWVALFKRLHDHLLPDGFLAVQTPVTSRRSHPLVDLFNLYMLAHENLYGVPCETAVRAALADAAFRNIERFPFWPTSQWIYLIAQR